MALSIVDNVCRCGAHSPEKALRVVLCRRDGSAVDPTDLAESHQVVRFLFVIPHETRLGSTELRCIKLGRISLGMMLVATPR